MAEGAKPYPQTNLLPCGGRKTFVRRVKTALKGVRLERAERVLDVPYKSSDKKKKKPEGDGSTSNPRGDGHLGI